MNYIGVVSEDYPRWRAWAESLQGAKINLSGSYVQNGHTRYVLADGERSRGFIFSGVLVLGSPDHRLVLRALSAIRHPHVPLNIAAGKVMTA